MLHHIKKLQQRSNREKEILALGTAGIAASLAFLFWFSHLDVTIKSVASESSKKMETAAVELAPLATVKDSAEGILSIVQDFFAGKQK